jgi:site-specific DNA recombinase
MLRIAAYCRVSEEEQVRGENIDAQKMEITSYLNRYTDPYIITWYLDDGISSRTYLNERPEGSKLMAAVMEEKYDQVIIQRVDRLARDDLIAQVMYKLFKDHKITLISIHQNFDINTPEGQLMATTFSGFASYEYHVMRERLAAGRIKNAVKGRWNGGLVPYGYLRQEGGSFAIDPDTSQVYTIIKNMALEGQGANLIRQQLLSMGIPSPSGGAIWSKRTIIYMLKNPFYMGTLHYMNLPAKEGAHPALITPEEYETVQQVISTRGHRGKKGNYHLLSGLIKCSCGKGYAIRYTGKNHVRRYCCQHKYETVYKCQSPLIDADSLEARVVDIIIEYARHPEAVRAAIQAANQQAKENYNPIDKKQLQNAQKQLNGLQRLIRKKDEMYAAGILSDEQYEEEIKGLYERERKAREDLENLQTKLESQSKRVADEKNYIDSIKRLKTYWDRFDALAKQQFVRELIAGIYLAADHLIIDFGQFTTEITPSLESRGCWWF